MANLMLWMMAFAGFERALIRERQRGVYRGRKKALSDEQAVTLRQRAAVGEPKAQLAREFNTSGKPFTSTSARTTDRCRVA